MRSGRLGESAKLKTAYDNAHSRDNTLIPPDMSGDIPVSQTTKSPLSILPVLAALGTVICLLAGVRKK